MTSPIDIDDLDEIFSVNPGDHVIVENQPELATRKSTISQMQAIDLRTLPVLPYPMQSGDVFFGSDDTNTKFSTDFKNITFPSGTKIWVYAGTYLPGWKISPNTGDKLLAIKGGSTYVTGGTSAGSWTNADYALTVEQIPEHRHYCRKAAHKQETDEDPTDFYARKGKIEEDDQVPQYNFINTNPTGGGQAHNHGADWRPRAAVGVIIEKI